jgi:glycosyltransferase involved in cell wall biosynthesis
MTDAKNREPHKPFLLWISPGRLEAALDASTWLETTRELRNLGWNMMLLESGKSGKHQINGVEVHSISNPDVYILRQVIYHLKIVFFILANWSTTHLVLFSQTTIPWLIPLILYRRLFRFKYPLFVMDTRTVPMEDMRVASIKDRIRAWFYNTSNKIGNRLVDGQTAITRRMAEKIKVPEGKLWGVWPSGADVDLFTRSHQRRQWPKETDPIRLIYIGVLHYERNLMSLARATVAAVKEGMNFRLSLTGGGTEKADLQKFAEESGGIVEVNAPIPHDQVPDHLAESHVGVLPFPDEEKYRVSSPIKLFEYMASGMAVLATRIVCHTDVVKNNKYIFWAEGPTTEDLLAALRLIWSTRSALPSMGEDAILASKEWTWRESAIKLSNALLYGLAQTNTTSEPGLSQNRSTQE